MFLLVQPQGQGSRLLPRAAGVARAPAGAEDRGSAGRGDGGARATSRLQRNGCMYDLIKS